MDSDAIEPLARQILIASYEATFLVPSIQNARKGESRPVFLNLLGADGSSRSKELIAEAIIVALKSVGLSGAKLDVRILHPGRMDPELAILLWTSRDSHPPLPQPEVFVRPAGVALLNLSRTDYESYSLTNSTNEPHCHRPAGRSSGLLRLSFKPESGHTVFE